MKRAATWRRLAAGGCAATVSAWLLLPGGCEDGGGADGGPAPGTDASVRLDDGVAIELRWIPAGECVIGSPAGEAGRGADEVQHTVRISRGFWMSRFEVTQAQFEPIMGFNFSAFPGAGRPVERVTWAEAAEFCRRLDARLGGGRFRLPTEAEWEYACRAGAATAYHTGGAESDLAAAGWYEANAGGTTQPAGGRTANAFGLQDTHGNVWEWCADWYGPYPTQTVTDPAGPSSGVERVARGGSWSRSAGPCRAANRGSYTPGNTASYLGFRLVWEAP